MVIYDTFFKKIVEEYDYSETKMWYFMEFTQTIVRFINGCKTGLEMVKSGSPPARFQEFGNFLLIKL